mgnify:CR=1 FL=1
MVFASFGKSTDTKICDFELRHRWDMAVAEGDGIPCQIYKTIAFSNDFQGFAEFVQVVFWTSGVACFQRFCKVLGFCFLTSTCTLT